jgi:DNA-binding MarR family transcriptional regulator
MQRGSASVGSIGPRQLPDHLADQLILAAEAVVRYRIAAYRDRFKMTDLEYRMIMHVARNAPVSIGGLAALVGRDNAQVSRTVKSLIVAGLMASRRSRGTNAKSIVLSPEGHRTYEKMTAIGAEWEVAISDVMATDMIVVASHAMEQLNDAARKILKR